MMSKTSKRTRSGRAVPPRSDVGPIFRRLREATSPLDRTLALLDLALERCREVQASDERPRGDDAVVGPFRAAAVASDSAAFYQRQILAAREAIVAGDLPRSLEPLAVLACNLVGLVEKTSRELVRSTNVAGKAGRESPQSMADFESRGLPVARELYRSARVRTTWRRAIEKALAKCEIKGLSPDTLCRRFPLRREIP